MVKFPKISNLIEFFEIFEKKTKIFEILYKTEIFRKIFDFSQIFEKNLILIKIFEYFRFSQIYEKKFDFGQIFLNFQQFQI